VKALSAEVVRAEKQAGALVGRAERAEAGQDAERARAGALRTTIDELRAGQTLMAETNTKDLAAAIQQARDAAEESVRQRVARLEHDRATAVASADEAVRSAEQLREAVAERKGQGRWAWLRSAWRGE
jgi:N-methylhydantoinase B/oxoprolinase/acetone carboxylase alpha subunit